MADRRGEAVIAALNGLAGGFAKAIEQRQARQIEDRKMAMLERESRLTARARELEINESERQEALLARRRSFDSPETAAATAGYRKHGLDVKPGDTAFDLEARHGPLSKYSFERFSERLKQETERIKKSSVEKGGKQLPPDKVLAVQEGATIPDLLDDLDITLKSGPDIFGPIEGRKGALNPYNERAKTTDAQFRTASQVFGKYMEGGVLRKEDEDKYRKMFPELTDTPELAENKLVLARRMLQRKLSKDIKALHDSGYDTSGILAHGGDLPNLPGVLTKSKGGSGVGAIEEAEASGVENLDAAIAAERQRRMAAKKGKAKK